jgi:hypothetical protein
MNRQQHGRAEPATAALKENDMRNLRQRLGGFIAAATIAAVLGSATPAFAETGTIGGNGKNTCAFVAGLLLKVPSDSPAAALFTAVLATWECD